MQATVPTANQNGTSALAIANGGYTFLASDPNNKGFEGTEDFAREIGMLVKTTAPKQRGWISSSFSTGVRTPSHSSYLIAGMWLVTTCARHFTDRQS